MSIPSYRRIADLPEQIAIFPLAGAMLFPRWTLPLNIFEPRYLNMIDDAMAGSRMIGMVQSMGGDRAVPDVARIGCAGRITSYAETDDGRYLIVLTGVCRFSVNEIDDVNTPYRQATPGWDAFEADLRAPIATDLPGRTELIMALRAYVSGHGMSADWSAMEDAPIETLINALASSCPFSVMEKQALLEADTVRRRAETLIALLQMDLPGHNGPMQ